MLFPVPSPLPLLLQSLIMPSIITAHLRSLRLHRLHRQGPPRGPQIRTGHRPHPVRRRGVPAADHPNSEEIRGGGRHRVGRGSGQQEPRLEQIATHTSPHRQTDGHTDNPFIFAPSFPRRSEAVSGPRPGARRAGHREHPGTRALHGEGQPGGPGLQGGGTMSPASYTRVMERHEIPDQRFRYSFSSKFDIKSDGIDRCCFEVAINQIW